MPGYHHHLFSHLPGASNPLEVRSIRENKLEQAEAPLQPLIVIVISSDSYTD